MAKGSADVSPSLSAGKKSAQTKGALELSRAAKMAAWTRLNGKDDRQNPHTKANYGKLLPMLATDDPLPDLNLVEIEEHRKTTLGQIRVREGQGDFRGGLLKAYGETCCVTGCQEARVLEAAHIVPYKGPKMNGVTNGLLLRADIHTMFDKDLLTFDATQWPPLILVKETVTDTLYRSLHGATLSLPEDSAHAPNKKALKWRRDQCNW